MKYTVKILIPKNSKRDYCMFFIKGQMMVHAKPISTDVVEMEDGEILVYNFETNYKKYGRILRFAEFFNARMKHASTVKLLRKLATKYSTNLDSDDNRFFDRPANVDITEHPTVQEIEEASATWKQKIIKMTNRLKVRIMGKSAKE